MISTDGFRGLERLFLLLYGDLWDLEEYSRKTNRFQPKDLKQLYSIGEEEAERFINRWKNKGWVRKREGAGYEVTEKGIYLYKKECGGGRPITGKIRRKRMVTHVGNGDPYEEEISVRITLPDSLDK